MKLLPILGFVLTALAVIPEPPRLPNLVKLGSLYNLSPKWSIKGEMYLEEGRLVVKEGAGSIWSKDSLSSLNKDWTIEVVFRNSERVEVDDHLYLDSNGFSFWLLESEIPHDMSNYGGPRSYEGFHFLINNKEGRGLKIFANDGTRNPENTKSASMGECDLNYLDSMVPFTLRMSYSSKQKIFKVQVDNELCFKTDRISFEKLNRDFILGVSASTDVRSQEYWEILKLDSFNEVTEGAMYDHDLMKEGLVKMMTVTQTEGSVPTETPAFRRKSLMEKQLDGMTNFDFIKFDTNIAEINSKLVLLERTLGNMDNAQVVELSKALNEVQSLQKKQLAALQDLKQTHENIQALLQSHFNEIFNSVGILHQKVIEEIKIHQSETHNIEAKVDLLMANHKEILKQYLSYAGELEKKGDTSELFSIVMKWVSLPFFVLLAGLSLIVYRLRKDFKHSKII
ncbi:hypothetical protein METBISCDRAFT_31159 [Metschnikowia bicuspidata]|uniref:L-type lectin-like domain-containing protein n=1 Tax=Metschnikowia bicuspidata TaxID=27322 RepID=A0A4P9ZCK8_9ASCO|nr:hypothetical protein METBISCDRAFT_31159 [Metschnikowia bicuspidata]